MKYAKQRDRPRARFKAVEQQKPPTGSHVALMEDRLMTVDEVAALFGVRPGTVRTWLATRVLPSYRLGGVVRLKLSEIEAKLEACVRPALPPHNGHQA